MDLAPCLHCRRHVAITEVTCPFCTRDVAPQRPRLAFAGKLTRAAIFSAAIVGCDSKGTTKPAPAPEQHQAGSGSDDLEKMLDEKHVVDHPPVVDAAAADSATVAAITDAGVPVDAGKSLVDHKREMLKRQAEEHRRKLLEQKAVEVQGPPMPYGAPPARRRMV